MNMAKLTGYVVDFECSQLVEILRACRFSARKTGYGMFETDAPRDCIDSATIAIIGRARAGDQGARREPRSPGEYR
jgi:hypothetical protein